MSILDFAMKICVWSSARACDSLISRTPGYGGNSVREVTMHCRASARSSGRTAEAVSRPMDEGEKICIAQDLTGAIPSRIEVTSCLAVS